MTESILQRLRRLKVRSPIAFWGSVASILSFLALFIIQPSTVTNYFYTQNVSFPTQPQVAPVIKEGASKASATQSTTAAAEVGAQRNDPAGREGSRSASRSEGPETSSLLAVVVSHDRKWQKAQFSVDDQPAKISKSNLRITEFLVTSGPHVLSAELGSEKCSVRFVAPALGPVPFQCNEW